MGRDPPLQIFIIRLNLQPKLGSRSRVLVSIVDHRVLWQRAELGEGGVHLGGGAFEEAAAAGYEEGVPGWSARRPKMVVGIVVKISKRGAERPTR